MVDWGWPVGPLQLLDEVGIDVAAHVGEIVHEAFGDRMLPPPGMKKLLDDDRKGRKNGRGFYRYDEAARAKGGKRAKVGRDHLQDARRARRRRSCRPRRSRCAAPSRW